jgi:hypothetical protein
LWAKDPEQIANEILLKAIREALGELETRQRDGRRKPFNESQRGHLQTAVDELRAIITTTNRRSGKAVVTV